MITVQNVPDITDESGKWKRSYMVDGARYFTRAGMIWGAVEARCNPGGAVQRNQLAYQWVTNGFKDFQEFTSWCQQEFGYLHKEDTGRYWQLDKDILVIGNKVYSPEACCFVPARVNAAVLTHKNRHSCLPIGVSFRKDIQKYNAQVSDPNGARICVNGFLTASEAHRKYQEIKIQVVRSTIKDFIDVLPKKTLGGIEAHLSLLVDDYNNFRESLR